MVLPNFRGIGAAAAELCCAICPGIASAVAQIHNRAVFEIPDMLEKILLSALLSHGP